MPGGDAHILPALLEATLDVLDTPVLIHSMDAVVYANAAALRMLRAPDRASVEGLPLQRIVHPDGWQAGEERRRIMFEHGSDIPRVRVKLRTLDGATLYVEGEARAVRIGDTVLAVTLGSTQYEYVDE